MLDVYWAHIPIKYDERRNGCDEVAICFTASK
jgi:hypothetical protein